MKRYFISWHQTKSQELQLSPNIKGVWITVKGKTFCCYCAVVDADNIQQSRQFIKKNFDVDGEFRFYQEKDSAWMPTKF